MKRTFQFSLLLMVITYFIGDLVTTINAIRQYGFSAEGNIIARSILMNFDLNIFILFKILATIIGCFALAYCYRKGFPLTAIITSIGITILSVMVIINNSSIAASLIRIENSFIFPIQTAIVLIPLILLIMEASYKEKKEQVKLIA